MKKRLAIKVILLITSLYITHFIGMGFFIEAFIAILRKNGVSLEFIGLLYTLGLFWAFKFLWAPIIDRFNFGQFGHYKIWIIVFQILMTITLLFIMVFDISKDLNIIVILVFLFAFFASSLNVSLDAFVYKIVDKKDYSDVSAIRSASSIVGMILGGGIGLIIYTKIDWTYTILILAIINILTIFQILFYRESLSINCSVEKINYKQFFIFWNTKSKRIWLFLLLLYSSATSSAFGLITPFLVDLGWSLDKIGFIVYTIGYGVGFLSSFIALYLIQKFGKKMVLIFTSFGQVLALLMLICLFKYNYEIVVVFVVGLIFIVYTPAFVIINTLIMDMSSKESPASQISIQNGIFVLSGTIFMSLSVNIAGNLGYEKAIYIFSTVGLFSVYLSTKIDYIFRNNK